MVVRGKGESQDWQYPPTVSFFKTMRHHWNETWDNVCLIKIDPKLHSGDI